MEKFFLLFVIVFGVLSIAYIIGGDVDTVSWVYNETNNELNGTYIVGVDVLRIPVHGYDYSVDISAVMLSVHGYDYSVDISAVMLSVHGYDYSVDSWLEITIGSETYKVVNGVVSYHLRVVLLKRLYDGVDANVSGVYVVFVNLDNGDTYKYPVGYDGYIASGHYKVYVEPGSGVDGDKMWEVEDVVVMVNGNKVDAGDFVVNGDTEVQIVVGVYKKTYRIASWTGDVLGDWILLASAVLPLVIGLVLSMFFGWVGFLAGVPLLVYYARVGILPGWVGVLVVIVLSLMIYWRGRMGGGEE